MVKMNKLPKVLTTTDRKHIAPKNFVFPKTKSYPIHDLSHARSALSMVSAHGSPSQQAAVRSAVYSKYPALKKRSMEKNAYDDRRPRTYAGSGAALGAGLGATSATVNYYKMGAGKFGPKAAQALKGLSRRGRIGAGLGGVGLAAGLYGTIGGGIGSLFNRGRTKQAALEDVYTTAFEDEVEKLAACASLHMTKKKKKKPAGKIYR